MNISLVIHNVGFIISAIASIGVFFFLIFNKDRSLTSVMFGLTMLGTAVWSIAHVIGVNIADPIVSRNVLLLNLVMVAFTGPFNVHAILAFLGKARQRWFMLVIIYAIGIGMAVWFLFHPDQFFLPSVPKMYFTNYYNPGVLDWMRIVYFFVICFGYMMIELLIAYDHEADSKRKQQTKYWAIGLIIGYLIGNIPNFLVYNIPIDPFWGTLFVALACIPFIYGLIKYDLFDIRIVAKQAFVYGISVAAVGGIIILFNYSNQIIEAYYPEFPFWITPLISALIVVLLAGFVWRKLKESDLLKYEFVTTVTHKFRTPLTHIKWASENLSKSTFSAEDLNQIKYIQSADEKLVELTRLLMNISESESGGYEYRLVRGDISTLAKEVSSTLRDQYAIHKVTISEKIEPGLQATFDHSRIKFIIQTFIENAIHYTPEGGAIDVSLSAANDLIIFSVKDSGIGITKEELPLVFSKFYRSKEAREMDTEGMGIGLYVSEEIIARHGGKIWVESEGAGKGSAFSFSLPKNK